MAGCIDNRFEKMLYAYELGMLSEDDRTAIEMHHLECDYCFEKAKKFNKSAQLIQCDSSVRDTIHQIAESETSEKKENKSIAEKNSWPIWIRSSLAVAAVLVILILQPWKIEISPRQDLVAAENLLIVMPFSTLVDVDNSQKFGEIVANLIMTDLSESQELQVVSNRHLFDITKRLGIEDSNIYDNDLSLKIAKEINAKWVITGDILQTEPFFIVTSRIIEIATGNIITTQKISGEKTTSVFSLADSLSVLINNDIPVESSILQTSNRMVADVTTHSQDAYRCYLEGVDYSNRAYFAEAVERFEKAIEYDSTFAMAYYYLSNLKDYKLIQKAVEYSEHSTQMEKYFINAKFAIRSRDAIKAIEILQELIDNYPYEKDAYYQIGILKYRLGQFDETID
ncbi:MAG: hypothetical protein GY865_15175, partial [candidate division Zixibacteria bacterium]|nr:hypothetical protein [candidate division Zixibacteria bacterium]